MKIKKFNESTDVHDVQFQEEGISFFDLMVEKMSTTTGYVIVSFMDEDGQAYVYSYPNREECSKHWTIRGNNTFPLQSFSDEFTVNENESYLFVDGKLMR